MVGDRPSLGSDARALRIANRLRLNLAGGWGSGDVGTTYAFLNAASRASDEELLDIVDAVLAERRGVRSASTGLEGLLRDGGSAYAVSADGGGLERRVPRVVKEAVSRARRSSAAAQAYLDVAWRSAYGRRPDPTVAYAEAVKAIEAAVIPVVLPNDPKATLGRVLAHLRGAAAQWELAILDAQGAPAGIDPLVGLLGLIWHGHRDRHAGTPTAVPVTAQGSEMAVHAAAMIVHWLSRGALRRRP